MILNLLNAPTPGTAPARGRAIGAGVVALLVLTAAIHAGVQQYRLWRSGGIWCLTMEPDGTITKSYGVEACGP